MLLVIGYGNSLNSDDGFGIAVAEALRKQRIDATLNVISDLQLKPEFIEAISQAREVIFVDANKNLLPGQFERLELTVSREEHSTPWTRENLLTHYCQPEQLVESAYALYGKSPRAWLYSVGGENFEHGENISLSVLAVIPEVVAAIMSVWQA